MNTTSKEWHWGREKNPLWLTPSEESHYLAARWKDAGFTHLLDFGCGLGRHSIFFARHGFSVSAFDLSSYGVSHLIKWAEREGLNVRAEQADMLNLPYEDGSFDCLFEYHVSSHTTTDGFSRMLGEMSRVLRPGAEFYLTVGSKETWSYALSGYPRIDRNTVVNMEEGPEKGVPHFYADLDDILALLASLRLRIHRVRHVDECYYDDGKQDSKHYFVLGQKEK